MKKLLTWSAASVLVMFAAFFIVRGQISSKPVDTIQQVSHTNQNKSPKSTGTSSTDNNVATTAATGSGASNTNNSYNPTAHSQTVATMTSGAGYVMGGTVTPGNAHTASSVATPVMPATPVTPVAPVTPVTPADPATPVTPANPVAPTVTITAPVTNATVSDSATVSATATASTPAAVSSVAFSIDGVAASTSMVAPYGFAWDTTKVTNGTHTITAIATDSNKLTTAATVTVMVNNVAVTPVTPPVISTNLIANPSFEDSANNLPTSWTADGFGTNNRVFTYNNTGHTGSHSVTTTITTFPDAGDAKWLPANVAVTAGQSYKYSNWYKATVPTEVDAAVTMSNGTVQYFYVAGAAASADWAQVNASFTMPVGAVSASFYHDLAAVGSLTVDDVSLTSYTPAPFNHAVVSLSIDDGYLNEYTNGLPLFQKYGFSATYFVLPGAITYPDYITDAQIVAIHNAGMEIGDHTYDHCDLTGVFTDNAAVCPTPITQAQVMNQLTSSKTYLESLIGVPVTNFATPYGAYNSAVISDIQAAGLASHRSTDVGYNSADTLNPYNIKVQNITNTTTPADVAGWVANAIANKEWLVIVYHEVTTTPQDPTYAVTPANLDTELAGIKASGVSVKNISAALAELKPQAGL